MSGILVKATGHSVLDFAAANLFSPLKIAVERTVTFRTKEEQMAFNQSKDISGWAADQRGINTAGWGLTLSSGDLAKLGQLYLDGGMWNGKQIVSQKWIDESTKEHSRWEKPGLSYGYLWWIHEEGFAAMGDGGNILYVNTHKKMVISIVCLFKPKVLDSLELIKKYIEPIFGS